MQDRGDEEAMPAGKAGLDGDDGSPEADPDAAQEAGRGRDAWRPRDIDLPGWRDILLRMGRRIARELVPLVAAGVAFFAALALFPAIAMLVSLAALLFDVDVVLRQIDALDGLAPPQPLAVVRAQAEALADQTPGQATTMVFISLALSLFWASRGIDNLVSGINMAHAEPETRNLIRRNIVSLWLTVVLIAMVLVSLGFVMAVPRVAGALGVPGWSGPIVDYGRWPVLALLSVTTLCLFYRQAAPRRAPRWNWVAPGAIAATALWLGGSVLFSTFVRNFASFQPTYGALAGVVILLLYLWLTAFVVLLGALLNAEMEHQSRRDTTRGRDRPMGQRGARMADTLGRRQ